MNKYSNGKIYLIGSPSSTQYYIGATIEPLDERFRKHKSKYKSWLNKKYHNCSSFKLIQNGDCYIKLVEEFPCNSKKELDIREGQFQMECLNMICNTQIAGRTRSQQNRKYRDRIKSQRNANATVANVPQIDEPPSSPDDCCA